MAVANRIFSSVVYTEASGAVQRNEALGSASNNDLKVWFKTSVLNCCISLFEGIKDQKVPSQMLDFFELKNLVSQLVVNGRLVGLVEPWERSSAEVRGPLTASPRNPPEHQHIHLEFRV